MTNIVFLPNQASLHVFPSYLRQVALDAQHFGEEWVLKTRTDFVYLHPFALAHLSAWGAEVHKAGGSITYDGKVLRGIAYAIRMGLFNNLGIQQSISLTQHEPAGRFIPVSNIRTSKEMDSFVTDLVPLFHFPGGGQDAIRYCMSEMVRNVLEHSNSPSGAFACAQYYPTSKVVAIGVADAGWGVRATISRNYQVNSDLEALIVALQPGTSGATGGRNLLGSENAGAGLFYTKAISRLGGLEFGIASGTACYRLNPTQKPGSIPADPMVDNHAAFNDLPTWAGTIVGVNVSTNPRIRFEQMLKKISNAYGTGASVRRKDYSKRVRFG